MSEQNHSTQLVIFTLGAERYALRIGRVQEIIRYIEPRSVASAHPGVRGVLNLRGRLVPVHDLAARLGITAEASDASKIVVVETGSTLVGVIVDAVEEVITIDDAHIEHAPAADPTLIDSIAKLNDRLVVLLNADTIFTSSQPSLA